MHPPLATDCMYRQPVTARVHRLLATARPRLRHSATARSRPTACGLTWLRLQVTEFEFGCGMFRTRWWGVKGWPEPCIYTVYDLIYGDFPAKNTVYTSCVYIYTVYTSYIYMVLANPSDVIAIAKSNESMWGLLVAPFPIVCGVSPPLVL
jgi:hypothetical protein